MRATTHHRPGKRPLWPALAAVGALALLLRACPHIAARAAPPAPGSEDAQILAPHSEWVRGLKTRQGYSCCDESDCRPVEARATANGWQVRWRPGQLPGAPTTWTDVPADAVLARENPVGVPVACWYDKQVRCFVPGGAI